VAVDPVDPKRMIAAIQTDGGCVVRKSNDAGRNWQSRVLLPTLPDRTVCTDPVVAYAPDGARIHGVFTLSGRTVYTSSTDGGRTWTKPALLPYPMNVIYPGSAGPVTNPRLATPLRASGAQYVYLAGTIFIGESSYALAFTRSANGGTTWSPWITFAEVSKFYAPFNEGLSVTGGPAGRVSLVWDEGDYGDPFDALRIRAAHSTDYGATFAPAVTAATESGAGVAYPFGGNPDARYGPNGNLHVVYSSTRYGKSAVRYTSTKHPGYTTWSPPVTVSDSRFAGGEVQVAPLLAVERCGSSVVLHVAWLDGRRGAEGRDMYYSRTTLASGAKWSSNIRVSDAFSPSIPATDVSDYERPFTALAAGGGQAIALWTYDYPYYPYSAVVGSRIRPGVNCQ
jgi:hypothetical protein